MVVKDIVRRIDRDLDEEIRKFAEENDLSMRRSSKEIAKQIKQNKLKNKIEF